MKFYKYQGAGNDFVVIDARQPIFENPSQALVVALCDRRFGIGADGLMLLKNKEGYDFEMVYYNADGREGSMCGNGGRCIVAFAHHLGIIGEDTRFWAVDGEHEGKVIYSEYIELKMGAVSNIQLQADHCFLNTGSPHYISFVSKVSEVAVVEEGRKIRFSPPFAEDGVNVNFVEISDDFQLKVATYERGVEDETLACGTGVTAAALAYFLQHTDRVEGEYCVGIQVKGGELLVRFAYHQGQFSDIWLCGPAVGVFEGEINV